MHFDAKIQICVKVGSEGVSVPSLLRSWQESTPCPGFGPSTVLLPSRDRKGRHPDPESTTKWLITQRATTDMRNVLSLDFSGLLSQKQSNRLVLHTREIDIKEKLLRTDREWKEKSNLIANLDSWFELMNQFQGKADLIGQ